MGWDVSAECCQEVQRDGRGLCYISRLLSRAGHLEAQMASLSASRLHAEVSIHVYDSAGTFCNVRL